MARVYSAIIVQTVTRRSILYALAQGASTCSSKTTKTLGIVVKIVILIKIS